MSSRQSLRRSVEVDNARVVIIDSLNGYLNAMPDERFLILQMHELLSYPGTAGRADDPDPRSTWAGRSDGYAARHQLSERCRADAALFRIRRNGAARLCPSSRSAAAITSTRIREFRLGSTGIKLGPPLQEFSGHLFGQSALYRHGDCRKGRLE